MSCCPTSREWGKFNRHCASDLGLGGGIACYCDNGYVNWLLHWNVFPLRGQNSILSGKGKGLAFEEFYRSPITELAFEFDYKKEFMFEVFIKIHQISKTSECCFMIVNV